MNNYVEYCLLFAGGEVLLWFDGAHQNRNDSQLHFVLGNTLVLSNFFSLKTVFRWAVDVGSFDHQPFWTYP